MICSNCKSETRHIKVYEGKEYCPNCSGMSEAGGVNTDGILTRQSFRIRSESIKHEKDFIPPHTYDKGSKKIIKNPDFAKAYPQHDKEID